MIFLPKSSYFNLANDNQILVGGLFTAHDCDGISIEISYDLCKVNGFFVDWMDFLADAGRQKDWKFDWATEKIKSLDNSYDKISYQFNLYGQLILKSNPEFDFIKICEYIIETKQKNATKEIPILQAMPGM